MKASKFLAILLALSLMMGLLCACGGSEEAVSTPASEVAEAPAEAPAEEPVPAEPDTLYPPEEESVIEEPASVVEEPVSVVEEPVEEAPSGPCTVTFSDGQTFEATIGEDFVFFFQCNAPGDMGEPAEGEEGAGITVSEGTVTYSNVGLGGPYSYPTSEKVTISGFTGDITVTITEAATFMGATYTIYTDEQEIADAIAFAEAMAAQQAANPMP